MHQNYHYLIPQLPPTADIFAPYQLANEFRRETEYRQQMQEYCQWYYETARKHQAELEAMRGDINIFGWFLRGKR
ncbi:MAG: hypothetical protein J7647_14595 [Cyanobacteria bacterium SBLK]|nr:hypothetical protein [Cyanobacteria bacterium SBLK]